MKKDIQLYLKDKEIYFEDTPKILFTYQQSEATDPTVVKNSFTKTVTIAGIQQNNQIFNSIWHLDRIQSSDGEYFNPSQRVPFKLFLEGDLVEEGYCKLDSVSQDKDKLLYNLTLYGGLGDFFFNLTYNEEGEKRRLSDLIFTDSIDPDNELTFYINKETVREAWSALSSGSGAEKWGVINFMPAYNGIPDNLSPDKILVNTRDFTSPLRQLTPTSSTSITGFPSTLNSSYNLYNGFGLATPYTKMTEWEMRDLRSYNQRPCLNVAKLLDALANPQNNGGYTVVYDANVMYSDFYRKGWMTLPLLNDLEVGSTEASWPISLGHKTTVNGFYNTYYDLNIAAIDAGTAELTAAFDFQITLSKDCTANKLYTSTYLNGEKNFSAVALQLVGLDSSYSVVAASQAVFLTSKAGNNYLSPSDARYNPLGGATTVIRFGEYTKANDRVYSWPERIVLSMNTSSANVTYVRLYVTSTANLETVSLYNGGTAQSYGYRRARYYTSTSLTTLDNNAFTGVPAIENLSGTKVIDSSSGVHSGTMITKRDLLTLDGTPCDYLLSFCKLFHLYIEKDRYEDTIYIRDSTRYFLKVEDIQDKIDRGKPMQISPLSFNSRWYDFKYPKSDEIECLEKYKNTYGADYGKHTVNTGYSFNTESNDMLKSILFKNGVDVLEKSRYFRYRLLDINDSECPTFLFTPATYALFNSNLDKTETTLASPTVYIDGSYGNYDDYYDSLPRVQLHNSEGKAVDGSGILVFYNGFKNLTAKGQAGWDDPLYYYLTDDLQEMITLSGGPCWLFTASEYNTRGNRIAYRYSSLPAFQRMQYSGYGYIGRTWDIGKPKELYVPDVRIGDVANIFPLHWDLYISDLYSINTRVVECYVKFKKEDINNCLRKIYFFDNCWWTLTKLSDYDYNSDASTKCTFTRVNRWIAYTDFAF